MKWFPVAFLTNGIFIVTRVGLELTPLCHEYTKAFTQSRLGILKNSHKGPMEVLTV